MAEDSVAAKDQGKQEADNVQVDQQQPVKKRKISKSGNVAAHNKADETAKPPSPPVQPSDDSAGKLQDREIAIPASPGQTKGSKSSTSKQKKRRRAAYLLPDAPSKDSLQEQEGTGNLSKAQERTTKQTGTLSKGKTGSAAASQKASDDGVTKGGAPPRVDQEEIMPYIQEEKTWDESRNRREIKHGM